MREAVHPRPDAGYLPTLDGWRAVAISCVVINHLQWVLVADRSRHPHTVTAMSWGGYGVNLFFAISGFLICNRLLVEYRLAGRVSLRLFYVRRVFRIFPIYYFYLMALACAGAAGVHVSEMELTYSAVLCRNYVDPPAGAYTEHLWSLAVEEHFYLAWPLLLCLLRPRLLVWVTPALAFGIHVWRSVDSRLHLFANYFIDSGIFFRTDTRIDGILWGCFAALVWAKFPTRTLPAWVPYLTLLTLVAAIAGKAPALPLVTSLLFPVLIVGTVQNARSLLGRLLELSPVRWVGRLSYSIYIWQTLFTVPARGGPDPAWLATLKTFPTCLVAILACSVASHYLIERPMIRLGRRVGTRFQPLPRPGRF